ncbi:MAG TPA: histidine kinase [Euzebya sp.]|nr:histidine kinase [Euzebya sp.]
MGWLTDLGYASEQMHDPVPSGTVPLASALCVVPLLLRRRWPLAAFRRSLMTTLVAAGLVAPLLLGLPLPVGSILVVPLCVFAAVDRAREDIAAGVTVSGLAAQAILGNVATARPYPDVVWVVSAAALVGTVVFASTVRSRRQAQGALLVEESRSAAQQAARAVLEERTRIARELHDVVAHHMSVIAIQAEAAPLRAGGDATALATELAEIRSTALDSMREMRRILGVLREDSGALPTAPAPGLDDLNDLVATARAAGLTVHTEVLGTHVALPGTVGLTAYRIVQESLANAMRHAPGSTVAIAVTYRRTPAVLAIDVHSTAGQPDSGLGSPEGTAHGLVGMRERVMMLGGDLTTGPSADGGFLVQARVPLEAA